LKWCRWVGGLGIEAREVEFVADALGIVFNYCLRDMAAISFGDSQKANPHATWGGALLRATNLQPSYLGRDTHCAVSRKHDMQFKPLFRPIRFMAANKGSTSTEIFYLCQSRPTSISNESRPI
jgi:hypothetical protein